MANVGYLPLALGSARFTYAFHFPGMKADDDAFTVAGVRVSRLTWSECRLLEKTRFMDDIQGVYVYGRDPWFIVFTTFVDNEIETGITKYLAHRSVSLLKRATRLIKAGEVWDPEEFIIYERDGVMNSRDPRTFGRMAFELSPQFHLDRRDIANLEAAYLALEFFDRFRYDLALDRAEALLAASYSPAHIQPGHRLLPLIGALEILTGGNVGALQEAEWMSDAVRKSVSDFRERRNEVAHGVRQADHPVEPIRELTRALFREAVAWRLEEPEQTSVTGPLLIERCLDARAGDPGRLGSVSTTYPSLIQRPLEATNQT